MGQEAVLQLCLADLLRPMRAVSCGREPSLQRDFPKAPSPRLVPCALHLQPRGSARGRPPPAMVRGCSFAPTRKRVPVTAGALRCLLLLCSLSSEGKLWWEMLCCFGGLRYFSVKMKEMIRSLRGGGDGAIPASSYLHLLPQSRLAVAGLAAAGCGPQLRAGPG